MAELAGAEVIRHPINRGKGAALRSGFNAANGADIIVTMDADGQHYPSEIPNLIAPILEGEADVVNGSRYMNGNGKNTPKYRRLGQKVLDKATNFSSGLDITDSQSGFRAFAAHTVPAFRFKQNGFGIESEMLADAANVGLRVLVKVLHDMELNRPLFYFTVPKVGMGFTGIVMGLVFLRELYLGLPLRFGPTLLMIILTLVGIFMAFTGTILHSMSRMINEVKRN